MTKNARQFSGAVGEGYESSTDTARFKVGNVFVVAKSLEEAVKKAKNTENDG